MLNTRLQFHLEAMNVVNKDASSTRRSEIEDLIRRELELHLRHVRYDPSTCAQLCRHLCASIRSKTKQLNGSKPKTVVNVFVGQDSEQEVHLAVRTVADPLGDEMASAVFRNKHLFAIGLVHEMATELR